MNKSGFSWDERGVNLFLVGLWKERGGQRGFFRFVEDFFIRRIQMGLNQTNKGDVERIAGKRESVPSSVRFLMAKFL
ncbi:MAG TPA: hypothetical protein PLV55_04975 [Anaerohalosphaeraceae bacterium]|nr:hypothetical protein [Anaerohalosphaeraceae bacterium]HOL88462.1 hypothetical protein [Anaerohalosphaeraceae bacterium]